MHSQGEKVIIVFVVLMQLGICMVFFNYAAENIGKLVTVSPLRAADVRTWSCHAVPATAPNGRRVARARASA